MKTRVSEMRMSKFVSMAAVVLMAMAMLSGCRESNAGAGTVPVVSGLQVATATGDTAPTVAKAAGTVRAAESAVLAAQTTGRVLAVNVREGDTVRAGELLVRLDDAASHAGAEQAKGEVAASLHQVAASQSQAELAEATLKRYEVLRERKSVSAQEFDEVSRRAEAAKAQLEAAQAQLTAARAGAGGAQATANYARIIAPFAGVVTARNVDPGAMAMPGMPLVDVERAGQRQLVASVDESLFGSVRVGMSISVSVPSAGTELIRGRVAEVVPASDEASRSFLVKIDLPVTGALHSGMFGTALVPTGTHTAVTVPQTAVVTRGSLSLVWVLDEKRIASLRYVTVGDAVNGRVEVLSGLRAGEAVVLDAGDRELGGSRIEARP